MKEAYALPTKAKSDADEKELEALLEAARRATWDALYGPVHLRSGRFRPEEAEDKREGTAEQTDAPDGAPRPR